MTNYWPEGRLINTVQNRNLCQSVSGLLEAMRTKTILEARAVVCTQEHDLIVDLGFCQGRIPRCEGAIGICDGSTRDIALLSRVNKPVCFLVEHLEQNPDGSITPILSRRQAQLLCRQELLSTLRPGDIIPAQVTHLEPFGCFVDIGCGIPSLIPIDCISVSRIAHPGDRFRPGQDIRAIVTGIEENFRILLSHKELLGTWEENAACFSSGETVSGIVRSVEPYGIFVELAPNLAGLAEFKAGVRPGQHASVYIKSLIPDKMKIKLILIDSFDAVCRPDPPHYFVESGHMDCWIYSPASAKKQIQTVFSFEPA